MAKRKISYEQAQALDRGRRAALRNQRVRAEAARQQSEREPHEHYWGDWSCLDAPLGSETRSCRCGATETREQRPL